MRRCPSNPSALPPLQKQLEHRKCLDAQVQLEESGPFYLVPQAVKSPIGIQSTMKKIVHKTSQMEGRQLICYVRLFAQNTRRIKGTSFEGSAIFFYHGTLVHLPNSYQEYIRKLKRTPLLCIDQKSQMCQRSQDACSFMYFIHLCTKMQCSHLLCSSFFLKTSASSQY